MNSGGRIRLKHAREYMKTIESIVDKYYEKLFDEITSLVDDIFELKIEYKDTLQGKTIIRSWKDREERLTRW